MDSRLIEGRRVRPAFSQKGVTMIKNNKIVELKNRLRELRKRECFPVINRGKLWYDRLTLLQYQELKNWYQAWLDVTETLVKPVKPYWLDLKLNEEEII